MRAVIYSAFNEPIKIKDVPVPEVPSDGVLVEVKAAGICRSDWWGWKGFDKDIRLPHVPGHEFAGIVSEVGEHITKWKKGDRVTAPFVCGCGNCTSCSKGHPQVCTNQTQPGFTHWGSFAEFVVVKNADFNLVAIPDAIEFKTAASLGCRFGTAFHALIDQAKLKQGQTVMVLGCGGVGLSAIMIAVAKGAEVIAVDINKAKLDLATRLGAIHTINLTEEEFDSASIHALFNGGVHVAVDALGNEELINYGLESLRPRGKHIQIGLCDQPKQHISTGLIVSKEIRLIGAHGVQATKYPEMFDLILSGQLDPAKLITGIVSLEQAPRIIERIDEAPPIGIAMVDIGMY